MATQFTVTTRTGNTFTMKLTDETTPNDLHDLAAQLHRKAMRMANTQRASSERAREPRMTRPTGLKGWLARWMQS